MEKEIKEAVEEALKEILTEFKSGQVAGLQYAQQVAQEQQREHFSFQIEKIANGFLVIDSASYPLGAMGASNAYYCPTKEDAKVYIWEKLK